jgi:hypothetical protein
MEITAKGCEFLIRLARRVIFFNHLSLEAQVKFPSLSAPPV